VKSSELGWMAAAGMAGMVVAGSAAVAVGGFRPPERAATMPVAAITQGSPSGVDTGGIVASGQGRYYVKPDVAVLSLGVTGQSQTAADAQAKLNQRVANVIAAAKKLGVADKDIVHAGYMLNPNFDYPPGPGNQRITGYTASQSVTVKIHDPASAGKAIDALTGDSGANSVWVALTLDDPSTADIEARKLAVADAQRRAAAMAGASGIKLGAVVAITDTYGYTPMYPQGSFAAGTTSASGQPTNIPVSDLLVTAAVTVRFAIAG
jgi:uncharacterized protein YggE